MKTFARSLAQLFHVRSPRALQRFIAAALLCIYLLGITATIVQASGGTRYLYCPVGHGADVVFYAYQAGTLSTSWFYHTPTGGTIPENRIIPVPSKGLLFGGLPGKAGATLDFITWSFSGQMTLQSATCR